MQVRKQQLELDREQQTAKQKTWVQLLGQEDPLEKGMAIHFNSLAWKISGTVEPGGLPSLWLHRVGHD